MALRRHVIRRFAAQNARRDHSDADAARAELAGERARHGDEGTLAGDIGKKPRRPPERRVGCNVDDAAVAVRREMRRERARDEPSAAHIDPHYAIPEIEIYLVEALAAHSGRDGGIVDEAVNRALVLGDVMGEGGDGYRI